MLLNQQIYQDKINLQPPQKYTIFTTIFVVKMTLPIIFQNWPYQISRSFNYKIMNSSFFYDGGLYRWTGFYMIRTFAMKELKTWLINPLWLDLSTKVILTGGSWASKFLKYSYRPFYVKILCPMFLLVLITYYSITTNN